jgi:hypothetical protein
MLPKLIVAVALTATNLLSSTTFYESPYEPLVRVVSEKVSNVDKVEFYANKYGVRNIELLKKIIYCESKWDEFAINVNKNNTIDRGLLQLNTIHENKVKALGMDITNPDNNLEFAIKLFAEEGTRHWRSSQHCWSK